MENFEYLNKFLNYEPSTGLLTWKVDRGMEFKIGDVAGSPHHDGYIIVRIEGSLYQAHRVCWILGTESDIPDGLEIDHVDTIRSNNRLVNLRPVNLHQQAWNKGNYKSNITGVKGVGWHKGKLRGRIQVHGKQYHVGYFDSLEEASIKMNEARKQYHGEFANHGHYS